MEEQAPYGAENEETKPEPTAEQRYRAQLAAVDARRAEVEARYRAELEALADERDLIIRHLAVEQRVTVTALRAALKAEAKRQAVVTMDEPEEPAKAKRGRS